MSRVPATVRILDSPPTPTWTRPTVIGVSGYAARRMRTYRTLLVRVQNDLFDVAPNLCTIVLDRQVTPPLRVLCWRHFARLPEEARDPWLTSG
jgi:hypothetical protein